MKPEEVEEMLRRHAKSWAQEELEVAIPALKTLKNDLGHCTNTLFNCTHHYLRPKYTSEYGMSVSNIYREVLEMQERIETILKNAEITLKALEDEKN